MSEPIHKVLLVDDDEVTNMLHTRLLKRSGLVENIDVTTDGLAALEYLNAQHEKGEQQPELIFLDINMPRMNGFEFLESYAELDFIPRTQQIVIMLSTSLLKADHARAEADPNVYRFANKPIKAEEILNLVEEYQALCRQC